jgi:alanyl-tRNA synthetase
MQQHTGQHILSAAFEKVGSYHTVSFHLGDHSSSIDLDSDRLGAKQFEEVENTANLVIFENRPVRISFQAAGEANRLDLRKPTFREGEVRLVEVEGFDLSACGGTHVSRTGAVGLILVRKVERSKGLTRVEFVCGMRALRHARRDFRVLSEAARLFSANLDAVPELIAKESQNLREAIREKEKLFNRLAEYQAREFWQAAPLIEGRRLVRLVSPAEESAQAKALAHALAKLPSTVAVVGVMGKPTALFFAQSAGGPSDMGSILKQTITKFGGKGGGGRDFAQAGGMEESRLDEALGYAEALAVQQAGS